MVVALNFAFEDSCAHKTKLLFTPCAFDQIYLRITFVDDRTTGWALSAILNCAVPLHVHVIFYLLFFSWNMILIIDESGRYVPAVIFEVKMAIGIFNGQNFQTSPAKLCLTPRTYHLVTAFSLLYWVVALGTRFCAVFQIHEVFSFVLKVGHPFLCKCSSFCHHRSFTPFEWMELLFATRAKLETTNCALSIHFYFIDFCRCLTLNVRTPAKIFH